MGDERRRNERAFYCNEVEVVGYGLRRSSDLSVGGMFLESTTGYPPGTVLQLRFKLKEEDLMPIAVQAKVLYSAGGIGVGLEFIDLALDDRLRIQKLVGH